MNKKVIVVIIGLGILVFLMSRIIFSKDLYIEKGQEIINCEECLVTNEKTAVKIAEAILFNYYDEEKIKSQRPYNITLMPNNIWLVRGNLNNSFIDKLIYFNISILGGEFEIKIDGKDGKIINVTHYK